MGSRPGPVAGVGAILSLAGRKPFAEGRRQLVFEYPGNPSLAIKVLRPGIIPGKGQTPWSRLAARYYHSVSFNRVWREFERWRRKQEGSSSRYLQRVTGLVETDLGLGLVVEAERGVNGDYAPTLQQIAASGAFLGDIEAAFERFCSDIEAAEIVVSDLNPRNIVYAVDQQAGGRFVLIDGTGDDTFIPILHMSSVLNGVTKRRKVASLRRKVGRLLAGAAGSRGQP